MAVLDAEKKLEINQALIKVFEETGYLQKCLSSDGFCWKNSKLNIHEPVMQQKLVVVLNKTCFDGHHELCSYIVHEFISTIEECCKLKKGEKNDWKFIWK